MVLKKVIFIEPKAPGYNIFSKFALPRLGSVLLATILENRGYETEVYFEERERIDWNSVASADLIGISTITSTAPRAYMIARRISRMGMPIVFGGPHPTFLPEEALDNGDFVIRGEGEETLLELIAALEGNGNLKEIKGLSYNCGGQKFHNPDRGLCENLDLLPEPNLKLIKGYKPASGFMVSKIVPVITSRGCPFHCNFCTVTQIFGRGYRFRSAQLVIDEIKKYQGSHIFFYDDNFAADKKRTKDLLRMMMEQNAVPASWSGQVCIDVGRDEQLLGLMKKTNCDTLYIGIESINPKTLRLYHKAQSVEQIVSGVKRIKEAGIRIHGMFVLGSDEDDIKVIRETLKFARKLGLETVQFMILTPLPGSQVFSTLKAQNKIFTYDWGLYDGQHVVYRPSRMIPSVLQAEVFRTMKKFYSWQRVVKHFLKGEWTDMVIKGYAILILNKWQKFNDDFKEKLRKGIYDKLSHRGEISP
ncbi:MAG: radical SAM protein [Acidobacteriota bacterium]